MAIDIRTHTESLSHKSKTELASFAQTRVSTAVNMVLNPIRYTVNKEDTVTSVSSILGISPSVLQQNLLLGVRAGMELTYDGVEVRIASGTHFAAASNTSYALAA